jgi:hypothetical protein
MVDVYEQWFELADRLQEDPNLIPSPPLYHYDMEALYAAIMDRLAQRLPDGSESPFSSMAPTTAHGILADNMAYYMMPLGRELNLVPDSMLLKWLRVLGAQTRNSEYPIINLRFTRHRSAVSASIAAEVPAGTEIRSRIDSELVAVTRQYLKIDGSATEGTVEARLSRRGRLGDLKIGEFSVMPRSLSGIEQVSNDGLIISSGAEAETLVDAVLRTRDGMRTGTNGGQPSFGRCVTDRDYHYWATQAGAKKVNVVRGVQYGAAGYYPDLITVICYPESAVPQVKAHLLPMGGDRCDVVPAEVVPIDGSITMGCAPEIGAVEAFNLAAIAIRDAVNPPHGLWADPAFVRTMSTAIEAVDRVYSVPTAVLKRADDNTPLADVVISPWTLFEVQGSLTVALA